MQTQHAERTELARFKRDIEYYEAHCPRLVRGEISIDELVEIILRED